MEIAVTLSGMVDALPGKLGELLQQEFELLSGVRGDVAFFQAELGAMRAVVVRCEALDEPDPQTTTWIGQVRELAYNIEDWVDLYADSASLVALEGPRDEKDEPARQAPAGPREEEDEPRRGSTPSTTQ